VNFDVSIGTVGTDVCFVVDFDDDTSLPDRYAFLGNMTVCSNLFGNIIASRSAVGAVIRTPLSQFDLDATSGFSINAIFRSAGE